MSRRDTIIVAVLINAGLLIVLFASALKSGVPDREVVAQPAPVIQTIPEPVVKREPLPFRGDEVDQALSQFVAHPPEVVVPQQPVMPSFADDLNALAHTEAPIPQLAAPAPAIEKVESDVAEIKVKKGDMLEKIARQHRTTVDELMKLNHLTTTNLRIGQVLKIPGKGAKKAEESSSAALGEPQYYTVKNGDNPWTIAVKNHLKVEELLKLNNLNEEKARHLKPGDQLRIR
jgi:LysM repeat protein